MKEIFHDAQAKRIWIKDEKSKLLLSIPVTWGAIGTAVVVLATWLAAAGIVAALVIKCTIKVEKTK